MILKKKNGFFLVEILIVFFIIGLLFNFLMLKLFAWQEKKELDEVTHQFVSDLRILQNRSRNIDSKNYSGEFLIIINGVNSEYYTQAKLKRIKPKRKLPKNIKFFTSNAEIRFDLLGRPLGGGERIMTIVLGTKNNKYKRSVVIAMQTGRIRVE